MLRVVTTTDYLLADIANTLRKLAGLPPVQVKTDGEIIIPDEKPKKKRASVPKEEPAKVEDAGTPAKPAKEDKKPKKTRKKSGRKKK